MDLLKFITCGSVDDGKSTLIGRLLYDSHAVSPDVLEAIARQSRHTADGSIDLSLLTDGLRSEREQGITIDVAYKYFTTTRRKFIIADAPGHVQFTRNMVTGASNADAAIILIDARLGVTEQTRRHSAIAALLGIPHILVCINKMDLVGYEQARFVAIEAEYRAFAEPLSLPHISFLPVSALAGDNVVKPSSQMPWYKGPTLLNQLETLEVAPDRTQREPRFQVQYVIRPANASGQDYRGYAGQIQSGLYRKGDRVKVYPSGLSSTIRSIEVNQQEVEAAWAPQAVVLHLTDNIDLGRGYTIVREDQLPTVSQDVEALLCLTDASPFLRVGATVLLQHHSTTVRAMVKAIEYKLNIDTLERIEAPAAPGINDLVKVRLRTATPLAYDPYQANRKTGSFILVDEHNFQTLAAGMFQELVPLPTTDSSWVI